jgi:thiosulfate/3-mercaptopyruvate sulfurtransferase
MTFPSRRVFVAKLLLSLPAYSLVSANAQQSESATASRKAADIPEVDLLEPSALLPMLNAHDQPLILQVGSHVMYAEAHIAKAEYVGAAGTPDGIDALRKRVAALDKQQTIVLYCGCCPWIRCPNIRSAYWQLKDLGFAHVKALYIPTNFGTDWVSKSYPVAQGR